MHIIITGTAHIACGVASMKWYSVHPSVYLSTGTWQQKNPLYFAAVGLAGRKYQSTATAAACGGQI